MRKVVSGFSRTRDVSVDLANRGLSPDSALVVLSRAIFDHALLDAAVGCGAQLVSEKPSMSPAGQAMTVRTPAREYAADFLIGADGTNSLVRKKLARPFLRREMSIAAGYFVHGARASAITIRSITQQPGYLWSFPRPDHLAVGMCAHRPPRHQRRPISSLQTREWIEPHGLHDGTRLEPYAWPIPSVGFTKVDQMRAAGAGWMLLGDAAGFVDPLTREGIYYALLSGMWASEAIEGLGKQLPEDAYSERVRDGDATRSSAVLLA